MLALHEPKLTELDERYILEAVRSGWVSTGGPFVDRFEKEFAEYIGAAHAVSVCNGTVGLFLATAALKRQLNHSGPFHVLTSNLTFAATWNAILMASGTPVLVDTVPDKLNLAAADVKKFIDQHYTFDRTAQMWRHRKTQVRLLAIMPPHIMGWVADMERMVALGAELNLPVMEDAAESLGCWLSQGRHVGTDSKAAVFSFNGNKVLTTGGGGMIATNDTAFATLLKHLSTTAKTDSLRFVHDQPGYNFRLVNILAALGCSQLQQLPENLQRKRRIFEAYANGLRGCDLRLVEEDIFRSNHWINNVQFKSLDARERALAALLKKDIQCRPLWVPGSQTEFIRKLQPEQFDFSHSEHMWRTVLSLPSSPHLTDDQLGSVISTVQSSFKS